MKKYFCLKLAALFCAALIIVPASTLARPDTLITTYGREFVLDGEAFRFIGVNIRGICHYGKNDILVYTTEAHIDENLDGVVAMGGKVIRFFAPVKFAEHQENVNRLKAVLDKMESRGLFAIVSFIDVYNTGFCPKGDEAYYLTQPSGWTLLDDTWFAGGFRNNYKPYVELAVTQLKDHDAVFAWELGNELTDIKNPDNIIPFAMEMAAAIKAIDPHHMVTTGFLSIDHTQIGVEAGVALYENPHFDFITVHAYNGEGHPANHGVMSRVVKPAVLEEYGWAHDNGDRVANTRSQLDHWFTNRAARGFMNWGYQAQNYDIGDGDMIYGMDPNFHSDDWTELNNLYSARAAEFANDPPALPERLEPVGANVAPQSVGWRADSSFSGDYGGDRAYDGVISPGAKWTSDGSAPPHWLAIDLGTVRNIDGVTPRFSSDGGERAAFNLKAYKIQTGPSLDGPWTTDFDVENPAQFSYVHSLYDSPRRARCVRIYVTDCGVDDYCRLPELQVWEAPDSLQAWTMY